MGSVASRHARPRHARAANLAPSSLARLIGIYGGADAFLFWTVCLRVNGERTRPADASSLFLPRLSYRLCMSALHTSLESAFSSITRGCATRIKSRRRRRRRPKSSRDNVDTVRCFFNRARGGLVSSRYRGIFIPLSYFIPFR